MVELIIDSTFSLIADWFCFINMRWDYLKHLQDKMKKGRMILISW